MFIHGKNGKTNYSIREKINYYQRVLSGSVPNAPSSHRRKAKRRLAALKRLEARNFAEPELIATNDRHFGDTLDKPRLAVVIDSDDKGRVLVGNIVRRTSKAIILDNDPTRQIGDTRIWIDRSEIYETKIVSEGIKPLSRYDKEKVKTILRKKK